MTHAMKRLGDIFVFKNGRAFKKSEWSQTGFPIIRIQNLNNRESGFNFFDGEFSNDILVRNGDLLFSWSGTVGSSFGPHLWNRDEGLLNQHIFKIGCRQPIEKRFAFYALEFITEEIEKQVSGAVGLVHITKERLNEFLIPVPSDKEQRRIVAILDEAFEGIATAKANAEKNLQSARELFDFLLDSAIQGRLIHQEADTASVSDLLSQIEAARRVAISQGRAKAHKSDRIELDAGCRPELPSGWAWAQLDSLTVGISDGVHKTPRYVAEGIPFVTVKNLTAGPGISFDTLNYITREDHAEYIKRTNPEQGDVLITKDGTIGVVRLIETDVEFSIFVSVALIKPAIRELGRYLAYALRATSVQSQIVPQGAALKHLYLVDLRRLQVPLPSLPEQSRIVARLDELYAEIQRLVSLYERKIAALDQLKRAILHQAFTGQL